MALVRATKEERHQAILAAAREVFVRDGYSRARMEEVARRAHVGKGTLYEHFAGKEDLFLSLCSHLIEENVRELTASLSAARGAREGLRLLLRGLINSIESMVPLIGIYFEAWTLAATRRDLRQRCIETFRTLYEPVKEIIAALVRRARREGDFASHAPDDVATLLLATVDGLAYQALFILDPSELPRVARRAEKLFLQGLERRT